jgi:hypothetical protein
MLMRSTALQNSPLRLSVTWNLVSDIAAKLFGLFFSFYIFISPCAIIIKHVSQSRNNTQFYVQKVI